MSDFAQGSTHYVSSSDGTRIAFWTTGNGPSVVLVHGTTSDHTTFNELVPHLAKSRTVVTFDRRGRGQSGDGDGLPYHVEREFDDVAAVIARVAAQQGSPTDVISHSFGAFIAVGAAQRAAGLRALVAYSPGFGAEYPPGALEKVEAASDSDNPDEALQIMFREIIGMTDEETQAMRRSPVWLARIAIAGTVARECRADEAFLRTYKTTMAQVNTPVLVLSGATNTGPKREIARQLAAQLPTSASYEMPDQGHVAHHFAPAELAEVCLRFLADPAGWAAAAPGSQQDNEA